MELLSLGGPGRHTRCRGCPQWSTFRILLWACQAQLDTAKVVDTVCYAYSGIYMCDSRTTGPCVGLALRHVIVLLLLVILIGGLRPDDEQQAWNRVGVGSRSKPGREPGLSKLEKTAGQHKGATMTSAHIAFSRDPTSTYDMMASAWQVSGPRLELSSAGVG